jgi:hypothetical protein
MLVTLAPSLYSEYAEVSVSESIIDPVDSTPSSVCIKPWMVNSLVVKNAVYKEESNKNVVVDINLPLDPIIEVGKYTTNISMEDGLFCHKITLSSN